MKKLFFGLSLIFLLVCSITVEAMEVELAFVGDILVARSVGRSILSQGSNYSFAKVSKTLKNADIAFGNFESTLSGDKITGSNKQLVFRAPARFAKAVTSSGIDIVSVANNHMLDAGRTGVTSTINGLEKAGIQTVGAGGNFKEASACKVIMTKGIRVGFLAFTDLANFGLANAEAKNDRAGVMTTTNVVVLKNLINDSKKICEVLVVSFHFGNEYQTMPSARQQLLVKTALMAGGDIIIGHHPHVLQPVVMLKGKTVAYSLGNFVFDNHRPRSAKTEILIVRYDTETKKQTNEIIPCYIRNCQPQIVGKR